MKGLISYGSSKLMPRLHYYCFSKGHTMSVQDYQNHLGFIEELKIEWIKYWRALKLDFLICPGFGCQAVNHGKSDDTALATAYVIIWNVLDMCAGSIPVTLVR